MLCREIGILRSHFLSLCLSVTVCEILSLFVWYFCPRVLAVGQRVFSQHVHTLRGARCVSCVLRLRPFLLSCISFHLLVCVWPACSRWPVCDWLACSRWAFCRRCFLSLFHTCSHSWSTLLGLGGSMRDRKSWYHSLAWGVRPVSGGSRWRSSSSCSAGMTCRVRRRSVCMKPCSTA